MIVPMKKATLIVQEKDAQAALAQLRSLGIIHVEHQKQPGGGDIAILKEELDLVSRAVEILLTADFLRQKKTEPEQAPLDWKFIAKHLIDLNKRLTQLEEYSFILKAGIVQWQPWGDFDPAQIEALRRKGVYSGLYEVPLKEIKNIPPGVIIRQIYTSSGVMHSLLISQSPIQVSFKEVSLPKMGLEDMRKRLYEDGRMMAIIRDDICKYLAYLSGLKAIKAQVVKKIEFSEALRGMGQIENIVYLRGFIPFDKEALLEKTAARGNWGFLIEEPAAEDAVPTLIRNPRWVTLISPVFKLLEIIPGYRELDISPVFLCFLSLFFGMIIGDAGYGALYFLLTFLMQKKFYGRMKDQRVFFLFYLFSACAILWGLITGTVFGQEWYSKVGLYPLVPILNDLKFLQAFCFFLGALHLTLAHLMQGMRKMPSLAVLADLGWIALLWAGFFIARTLILDAAYPAFVNKMIIFAIALVVIFSSPQKNILKMLGQGLGTLALSLMNNFTDVVSYVRLFAVGLAGVTISDTVNTLAGGFPDNFLVKFLILFLGHSINIVLGPISVLVHGVRLNVLEFSGHAGLSWGGVSYKPLEE
jgi:V/A-type H+-transporting ATPase subunit I